MRLLGATSRRSKNPVSISVARAAALVTEPNSTPCTTDPASAKSRNESTSGKPGMLIARANDAVPRATKNSGKTSDGTTRLGWRMSDSTERDESAPIWSRRRSAIVLMTRLQGDGRLPQRIRRRGSVPEVRGAQRRCLWHRALSQHWRHRPHLG